MSGKCLCGQVTYSISGDLLRTAVCHCDHCQRQSGGAFSVNLVTAAENFSHDGTMKMYGDHGMTRRGRFTLNDISAEIVARRLFQYPPGDVKLSS